MFVVFGYVDMAWDPSTMITVAIAMALCDRFWRVPAAPDGPRPTTGRRVPVAPPTDVAAPAAVAA
jgi:hypothetical protein